MQQPKSILKKYEKQSNIRYDDKYIAAQRILQIKRAQSESCYDRTLTLSERLQQQQQKIVKCEPTIKIPVEPEYRVSHLCGVMRNPGLKNGYFDVAQFNGLFGACLLPDGTLIVSECGNNLLRAISLKDNTVSTYCENGAFLKPRGMCMYGDNILVCDSGHHRIRMITRAGKQTKAVFFAGSGKRGLKDGKISESQFNYPSDVLVTSDGSILVADTLNHRIRKVDLSKNEVITIAGNGEGYKDGNSSEAQFKYPVCLENDTDGGILVSDSKNNCIRKISKDFKKVTTFAGRPGEYPVQYKNGIAAEALFHNPHGLCVTPIGEVFVCDTNNNCIRKIKEGMVSTFCGKKKSGSRDGRAQVARFMSPKWMILAKDQDYDIFIVLDSGNSAIRLIHSIDYRTEPTQVKLQSPLAKPTVETKKKKRRALEFVSIKELGGKLEKSKEGDKFTHNPVYYEIIHCYEEELANIFLYYINFDHYQWEVKDMSNVKFFKFVRDCKLLDSERLTQGNVYIIFFEAVKQSDEGRMNFDQFIVALCLLAICKFCPEVNKIPSVNSLMKEKSDSEIKTYLQRLLFEYVFPNANQHSKERSPEELSKCEVIDVWSKYEDALLRIFKHYSTSWNINAYATMNIEQFYQFAKDFEISPGFAARSKLTKIFRSCQNVLSDDSNLQQRSSLQSIARHNLPNDYIDYFAFLECLGRIALMRYSEPPLNEIYPTPAKKIKALLEHMDLSPGREIVMMDSRKSLFENITSPRTKQEIEEKLEQLDPKMRRSLTHPLSIVTPVKPEKPKTEPIKIHTTAKDVTLYTWGHLSKVWQYKCTGNVSIVERKDTHVYSLCFHSNELSHDITLELTEGNIPYVEQSEHFHIWKHAGTDLYALQFPNPTISKQFEVLYVLISERSKRSSKKSQSTPAEKPMLFEQSPKSNLRKSIDSIYQTRSPALTQSMLESPKKSIDVSSIKPTSPKPITKESSEFSLGKSEIESRSAVDEIIGNKKETLEDVYDENVTNIMRPEPQNRMTPEFFKNFEFVLCSLLSDYSKQINMNPTIHEEILKRVRWTSGLYFSGQLELYSQIYQYKHKKLDHQFVKVRKEEVVRNLISLHSQLCSKLKSIIEYYDTILHCIPSDSFYAEIYVKDSLRLPMFCFSDHFCVVAGDKCELTLNLLGKRFGEQVLHEIQKVKVYVGKEEYSNIQLIFDEDKKTASLSFPLFIPPYDEGEDLDNVLSENFSKFSSEVLSYSLNIQIQFTTHEKTLTTTLPVHLAIFPSQIALNNVYAPLKEHILNSIEDLPHFHKPIGMFSYRTVGNLF